MTVIIGASAVELASLTVRAQADTRVNLSIPHLLSAATHSRQLRRLEAENAGKEFGEFWHDIFACASGAVFATVSALESYANEIFIDHKTVFPELRVDVLRKLWELYERKSILEKYELALMLKNKTTMRSTHFYSNVATVIELRNSLTHFKPEWFSEQNAHAKISAHLRNKATLSPFFQANEPLFPRGWTSHATVMWVINCVVNFLLEFEQLGDFEPRMVRFTERMKNL